MTLSADKYSSFQTLFSEQYSSLCNYANGFVNDLNDAEDVVQEVFIKIWQNRQDLIGTDQVRFYLFTATRNNCISLLRKRKHPAMGGDDIEKLAHIADEGPRQAIPPEDIHALVGRALGQLPPQCQLIFKMSRFNKLTYAQIAEELNLSVKTIENQMGKALRILRDFVKTNPLPVSLLIDLLFLLQ